MSQKCNYEFIPLSDEMKFLDINSVSTIDGIIQPIINYYYKPKPPKRNPMKHLQPKKKKRK